MMEANAQSVLRRVSDWVLAHPAHDPGSVRMKADGSRVTDADLAMHEGISALLAAHLPNCFVLSEEMEGPREPPERGWVAVLDPLDGTENFIDGRVEWSVCLSLWHDGVHAASGLILPSIGARLISGDPVARFNSDTVVISAGMVGKALPQKFRGARVTGSAGWNCYHVIRGSFAALHVAAEPALLGYSGRRVSGPASGMFCASERRSIRHVASWVRATLLR